MYIYSKINKKLIACIYIFKKKIKSRIDLSPEKELIQVSVLKLNKKNFMNKHIHTKIQRKTIRNRSQKTC